MPLLNSQEIRQINIDFNKEKGKHNKFFKECIGAGRANEGLRADWQEQLRQVKEECGFRYIRFHGLFHDDMGVYFEDEKGNPIYNWQYIDKLFDFILEIGMKPFVELSFMPTALASGDKTVFWWKGNITPPKSYEKWHDLVKAFTQHLTERYGEEEVSSWYFEVWNEPNLHFFWSGSMEEYFKLYKNAIEAIKSVSEKYTVGGPATAGGGWVTELLHYCDSANIPCEFIATHAYNVSGFLDEFGKNQLKMGATPNWVINQTQKARKEIEATKYKGLELHLTEWSSSYSPRDPVHDTYQNATYVLNTLKNTEGIANSMSYWVFTDIFEESDVPQTPFHGGFGLMNMQGIKKPTYFTYEYLNQLGDTELQNPDKNSWICKQGNNFQAIVWEFTYPSQGKESNQIFYRKKHEAKQKPNLNLNVNNLKDGIYRLELYKTGYKHNDVFTAYYEMGLPSQLTTNMVDYLKKASANKPIEQMVLEVKNGKWEKTIKLNENDINLVKLTYLK